MLNAYTTAFSDYTNNPHSVDFVVYVSPREYDIETVYTTIQFRK
jgi:hypothetical protein